MFFNDIGRYRGRHQDFC